MSKNLDHGRSVAYTVFPDEVCHIMAPAGECVTSFWVGAWNLGQIELQAFRERRNNPSSLSFDSQASSSMCSSQNACKAIGGCDVSKADGTAHT